MQTICEKIIQNFLTTLSKLKKGKKTISDAIETFSSTDFSESVEAVVAEFVENELKEQLEKQKQEIKAEVEAEVKAELEAEVNAKVEAEVEAKVKKIKTEVEKKANASRVKKLKDPNAPKRPASAYILWCKVARKELKEKNPNMPFQQVGKELGKLWKSLTDKQKAPYQEQTKEEKEEYEEKKKNYNAPTVEELAELPVNKRKIRKEKKAEKQKTKTDGPTPPKRPLSAYILFSKHIRPEIKKKNPNLKPSEIMREIGKLWKTQYKDNAKKCEKWVKLAKEDKERYQREIEEHNKTNNKEDKAPSKKKASKKNKKSEEEQEETSEETSEERQEEEQEESSEEKGAEKEEEEEQQEEEETASQTQVEEIRSSKKQTKKNKH